MYLSLPLPSSAWKLVKISFISMASPSEMRVFVVRVDNSWDVDHMINSFLSLVKNSSGKSTSASEIILADVYRNSIHKILNGAQPVSSIRQAGSVADNLFAYEIQAASGMHVITLHLIFLAPRVYIEFIHQTSDNLHTEPIETPFILGIPGGSMCIEELYKHIASRVLQNYASKPMSIKGNPLPLHATYPSRDTKTLYASFVGN